MQCISRCEEGDCKCPQILTTGTTGQPVVRCVDGFVHIHFGVHEFVLSAELAVEFGLTVTGNAALATRGFDIS